MDTPQNIYDDPGFFAGYSRLRKNTLNYNVLLEQPAFRNLLPDLTGKAVLDLGCGFGDACETYLRLGAAAVVGIDISEKMLEVALLQDSSRRIEYHRMDMLSIAGMGRRFDIITSSLAVHYIENFSTLTDAVGQCLNPGGIFLFSQEHPLTTAPLHGVRFLDDESGCSTAYLLADYGRPGFRSVEWFIDGVEKYHRTFSEIIDALIAAGFSVEAMAEPLPDDATLKKCPRMYREFIKPSFLIVRARKLSSC
ncbi:MAG: methyltransferase domain-containing protein [Sphaerochaetaceae bacterium]|nr:methyltransferase domain-containing protein [Sphaerochaetaceae bacterium]